MIYCFQALVQNNPNPFFKSHKDKYYSYILTGNDFLSMELKAKLEINASKVCYFN